mmetsp:Transcript_18036/g.50416  ORF Transcript_18036/g.50416 Transcript_18036/m.50416 type:complete len:208 (+) Transcript_18036:642-1265(+)
MSLLMMTLRTRLLGRPSIASTPLLSPLSSQEHSPQQLSPGVPPSLLVRSLSDWLVPSCWLDWSEMWLLAILSAWSRDSAGSGGFGEAASVAAASSQQPSLVLLHSQNTAGAPNVYSVARRSKGRTPRWRNMRASRVPREPPTLWPVKQIFVHGEESMASYTSGRKRLYSACAASYTPLCTFTPREGSSKTTGSNVTFSFQWSSVSEP